VSGGALITLLMYRGDGGSICSMNSRGFLGVLVVAGKSKPFFRRFFFYVA